MRLKTLRAAVVAMAGLAASACSTADLEMFNAGLEMYNGVQYYDQTAPDQRFDCGSGEGYVTRHRGVRSNQQYVYFTSHTPNQATIRVNVSGETAAYWTLEGYQTSDTHWTYPSYSLDYEWEC